MTTKEEKENNLLQKYKKENEDLRKNIKRLEDRIDQHNNEVSNFKKRFKELILECLSEKEVYRW